jgi:hypothetical protein
MADTPVAVLNMGVLRFLTTRYKQLHKKLAISSTCVIFYALCLIGVGFIICRLAAHYDCGLC